MKQYKVNEDLLQATINYLASKPYSETFKIIQALQGSEEVVEGGDEAA